VRTWEQQLAALSPPPPPKRFAWHGQGQEPERTVEEQLAILLGKVPMPAELAR
jgi:hypothetical protein